MPQLKIKLSEFCAHTLTLHDFNFSLDVTSSQPKTC